MHCRCLSIARVLTGPSWPGDSPSGRRPEPNAARELSASPEADKAPEVQGIVGAIEVYVALYMRVTVFHRHAMVLFSFYIVLVPASRACH